MYDIERYVFSNTNIIGALKKQIETDTPYDYPLSNLKTNSKIENDDVYSFKINMSDNIKKIANELIEVGLLTEN